MGWQNISGGLACRCGRTRMYLINIEQWQDIDQAHGEVFGAIKPATTMVEVKRLNNPAEPLVEIAADAISTGEKS